jgi:hypothetical protein
MDEASIVAPGGGPAAVVARATGSASRRATLEIMIRGPRFWCALALALLLPLKAAMAVGAACHLQAAASAQAAGHAIAHPCHEAAAAEHPAGDDVSAQPESDGTLRLACAAACAAPLLPGAAACGAQDPLAGRDWREHPFARPGSVDPSGLEKPPRTS